MAKTVYKAGSEGEVERISKRADLNNVDRQSAPDGTGPDVVDFWKTELGRYEVEFKPWVQRCENIVRRYRDERDMANRGQVKYAILWSNIQTLKPAVFSRAPQPIVERRYLDQDMLGRIASQTLERATETTVELGRLYQQGDKAILDYLLVGRGQLWDRYEPEYSVASAPITTPPDDGAGPEDVESDGEQDDQPDQEVTWEKVCTDYVYWADFAHSAARSWDEVWWVGRRAWLTREEGLKRFGPIFRRISLKKPEQDQAALTSQQRDRAPKAEVWEIWDKNAREVFFVAPDLTTEILERVPDPLGLHEFYPCPEPIYATLTNGSLVPVPDYAEYQDQADEIDNLTNRISRITGALKVVGLYAGDTPQLARLLLSTVDNTMIPVDNWAVFAEKGGVEGSVSWMPVKDLAGVLMTLYEAREAAKRDLFEITGMSDIVRGQASGAAKTATEQRIKGQFASLRLDSRRKDVARFMRDIIAITGEIIAEHFSPELLMEMTGMLPVITEELKDMEQSAPQPPQAAPQGMAGMGAGPAGPVPPGGAPPPAQMAMGPTGMGAPMPPPAPPPPDPQVIAMQVMAKAMELLRNDKMRTFRIDIESDSTVEDDAISGKEEVAEYMTSVTQFLLAAMPVAQGAPPLLTPLLRMLQYANRRFKMGRSMETAFDAAVEELEAAAKAAKDQPQEDPAQKAEMAKAAAQLQGIQAKAQADQMKAQTDMVLEQEKVAVEKERLLIEREKLRMEMEFMQAKHRMELQKMQMQASMPQPVPKAANGGAPA